MLLRMTSMEDANALWSIARSVVVLARQARSGSGHGQA